MANDNVLKTNKFEYTEAYNGFKVGDRVTFTSIRTNGHAREGKIVAVWSGKPFPYPFNVKFESPIWGPGAYVYEWAAPHEMQKIVEEV